MSDEQEEVIDEVPQTPADPAAEYLAGWKRALADYDNLKKELGRERTQMRGDAIIHAATQVLPVLDNFDTALKFVPEGIDDKVRNWLTGLLFIRTQLESAIAGMGLVPYATVGDTFDANLHDAVGERAETEVSPPAKGEVGGGGPRIVEVVARGWKLGDRIVRPAKVIVGK